MFNDLPEQTMFRRGFINASSQIASRTGVPALKVNGDLPMYFLTGSAGTGKSLIFEAMVKTWLDEFNVNSLMVSPYRRMFLEKREMHAAHEGLSCFGTYNGNQIGFFFSSAMAFSGGGKRKVQEMMKEKCPDIKGGVIFWSRRSDNRAIISRDLEICVEQKTLLLPWKTDWSINVTNDTMCCAL